MYDVLTIEQATPLLLAAGVERADSVITDCHKWLNVPYDCGVAFVRDVARLPRTFNVGAPYLPSPDDPRPNPAFVSPESSRRARALTVWATLRAYGRSGYRDMVERHLALARHLARKGFTRRAIVAALNERPGQEGLDLDGIEES